MARTSKKQLEADKELLKKVRERYRLMTEADGEQRRAALYDMKFANIPGEQWDANMKQERGNRPTYEFNKCRVNAKKVINEIRTNRPAGKVRAVEDGDVETAEIYEGLIRNICNNSDMDTITDYAADYQVNGGMGAWRVTTDYADDDSFFQDIRLEAIHNPFCLFSDPAAKDFLKRDAYDWILTERISKRSYEAKYPDAQVINFDNSEYDDNDDWKDEETVRICEYWWKEPIDKVLYLLQNGEVVDSQSEAGQNLPPELIKQKRTVKSHQIKWVICSGDAILERGEWPSKYHPFIVVYGEYTIIDGKRYWHGIHRFAKDAQQSYNFSRTTIIETIAQSPQAKYWLTSKQAEGHLNQYAEAHRKNFPIMLYNPDPQAPGPPPRIGPSDVPVALMNEAQMSSQDIDATQGIFGDDRGQQSQSQSGRAIYARQQQGSLVTFNYPDNIGKAIRYTWEILINLVPKIYDTERTLRILGSDGAEDYIKINTFVPDKNTGLPIKINDLSVGKYDVTVTIGPTFSSRRQEASEIYGQMAQQNPQLFGVAGDLIMKSMDLPYADEIAKRLQAMLPPPIQQMLQQGKQVPPEVQMMMQQASQAMEQVTQLNDLVKQEAQKVDMNKAELEKLSAQLDADRAKFEAFVEKELAKIATSQADLTIQDIQQNKDQILEAGRQAFNAELAQAVQGIQELAQQFHQKGLDTLSAIQIQKDAKPKIIRVDAVRTNGKLSAVPIYETVTSGSSA